MIPVTTVTGELKNVRLHHRRAERIARSVQPCHEVPRLGTFDHSYSLYTGYGARSGHACITVQGEQGAQNAVVRYVNTAVYVLRVVLPQVDAVDW